MKLKYRLLICSFFVGFVVLAAALAPLLVPFDPDQQQLAQALSPPDQQYLLGTDRYGRDLLSRVLIGARPSIFSALAVVSGIALLGTGVGVLCGFFGGRTDRILMGISDVFLAFPGMVLAIAVAGFLGGGLANALIAIAAISWPKYARIARSQVMTIRTSTYLKAARLNGCSGLELIWRHILPNISGIILVTAVQDIGTVIMELAGLSFLGLGAMPPAAEWGSMMSSGRSMIQTAPWVVLAPGGAMFLTVMIFNLWSDTLRDVMDSKYEEK